MNICFQIGLKRQLLMAVIFAATASFSVHHSANHFKPVLNASFLEQTNQLLQPIIIPNLTSFADSLFPGAVRPNQTQPPKITKNNTNNYFIKRIFYPDDSSEASQESVVRTKYEKDEPSSSEVSPRFSSRYSSRPGTNEDSTENTINSNESEETRNEDEKLIPDSTERTDSLENDETLSRNDVIQDEAYKAYLEHSENPYFDNREDEKSGVREYSDINEARETEDSEISPTTNEPYTELRRPTSFPKSHYPDKELRNYETSPSNSEERDASKEEETDSSSKNYHSIQTPLEEIKYRGPHSYDDEYEKTRTRLSPIRRHPISHNWPYSEAHLKVEAEKLNEISDSEERDDSDEVVSTRAETSSKLSDLERAAKRDESELKNSKNYNYIEDYGREKPTPLAAVEEKDHQTPFFKSIKQYKVEAEEEEEQPRTHPPVSFVRKPQPQFKVNDKLWSTSSTLTDKGKPIYSKLFSKRPEVNKLSKFNITKELSNFQGHQYLGPVVFNHNVEQQRFKPTTGPQKQPSRNIFLNDLTKKEEADQKNLAKQKPQILAETRKEALPASFNYQQESDEMYNQILASIQSVFGARTQPLKSAGSRKSVSEPHHELSLEENKSFTWSVPLRKRSNVNQDGSESSVGSKSKEKSGSEGKSEFVKSVFPSDIVKP